MVKQARRQMAEPMLWKYWTSRRRREARRQIAGRTMRLGQRPLLSLLQISWRPAHASSISTVHGAHASSVGTAHGAHASSVGTA
eukprot:1247096-Rhodomonas_salina.2